MSKLAMGLSGALLAGAALLGWAQQGRIDVRTAVTPIGTSSSNGVSFAWFYDATDRSVYVCRAAHITGESIDCKSKAQLP
jgi:hypothetical protein